MKVLISLKVINCAYGDYPLTEEVSVSRKVTYNLMKIHFLVTDYYFNLFFVSDMMTRGVYETVAEKSKSATLTVLEEGTGPVTSVTVSQYYVC